MPSRPTLLRRRPALWSVLLTVTLAGCSAQPVASAGDGSVDDAPAPDTLAPAVDASALMDAAAGSDAALDALRSDAGAPDAPATRDAAPSDTGPSDASVYPLASYDRSQIALLREGTLSVAGQSYRALLYRNNAYRCGRTGNYSFMVLEPAGMADRELPLWGLLYGGGVGYYDAAGHYRPGAMQATGWVAPNEANNDERAWGDFLNVANNFPPHPGARLVMLAMCDHDLYAGLGGPYPNNPNPGRADDRTEGALANMAALHFAVRGNGLSGAAALPGFATSYVFLHGQSAGSAGAYHVSAQLARLGVRINGAVLDSYVLTSRTPEAFAGMCTPLNRDTGFDLAQVAAKVGPWVSDPALLLEHNAQGPFALPYLFMDGDDDDQCCGEATDPRLAGATREGVGNCAYVYAPLRAALEAPGGPLHRFVVFPGGGHVVGDLDSPVRADVIAATDRWIADVLATGPAPAGPAFPR